MAESNGRSARTILPCRAATRPEQERRLFADGRFYHADGRRDSFSKLRATMPEAVSKGFPFVLLTGRGTASQWHTETRTAQVGGVAASYRRSSSMSKSIRPTRRHLRIGPGEAVIVDRSAAKSMRVPLSRRPSPVDKFFCQCTTTASTGSPIRSSIPTQNSLSYKACAVRLRRECDHIIANSRANRIMQFRDFLKSGHPGTLFTSLLYFDFCFAVWVLNGAMAPFIRPKTLA